MAIRGITFERIGNQELVTIDRDTTTATTVIIGKYRKILTEKLQKINLTPYLREEINLAPIISGGYTDSDCAVPAQITIEGETYKSGESYAIGDSAQDLEHCASDLPYRVIAHGQTDAVTVYLSKGDSADIEANQTVINNVQNNSVGTLVAMNIQPTTEQIKVSKYLDDYSTSYSQDIRYIFRPMGLNGKRIAWLNRYGAVDFWNFDYLREQSFGATAETIYTHNGYKKIARTAEKVFVVETREATREAIDALSFIIASPAVWVVNDDLTGNPTFEEVDVITEECKVFDSQELIGLQIAYRPKQRVL
jgi:hypothetical protein